LNALRVLLVDDSALLRRAMMSVLKAHAEIEVVAAVADGAAALSKLSEMPVDAVVLDVEMPGMNGLETLERIRQKDERLPVVMFSALTERGAEVTVRALAAGASDYVCKPGGPQGLSAEDVISLQLVPKILALCGRRITRPLTAASPPLPLLRPTVVGREVELLVIASSTGGPNALAELLPRLPAGLPVPVLIVQHMPPVFTRYLAERLNAAGPLPAREATDGELVSPGTIAVAPGDHHLEVAMRGNLLYTRLHQGPPENSCRPAADVLFRSAALAVGRGVLGVVLTGMGQDGLLGSQAIVDRGGSVLVQDEASCVVWGMPKAVEQAGLAEQVLPLGELSSAIALRCNRAGTRSAAGRR
jgi:two-component system, chemotaxis family, protein-glutamate methylesterase/glutaminase